MKDFETDRLWMGIRDFQLDDPDAQYPFSMRLARENDWPRVYAERVIKEYKKYCYMGVIAGHPVSPSDPVDQAWHSHILFTHSYWHDFCGRVLGQPFHHAPSRGGRDESLKFKDSYGRTLNSYREIFHVDPPADIWPAKELYFRHLAAYRKTNETTHWVIRKPSWLIAP